jgi:hypothetical protein
MVLVLSAATLLVLGATLQWSTTTSTLSERNNEYFKTVAAAEAATEKVLTQIDFDYKRGAELLVVSSLGSYRDLVPLGTDSPRLADYQFSDGQSQSNKTHVQFVAPAEFRNLNGPYRGLYGFASVFRVISNARDTKSRFSITGAVRQDVDLTSIPLFQFAIFYNLDLEINPGPVMTVTGPVHGNANIYLDPQNVLTFRSDVTAAGTIFNHKHPLDPLDRTDGTIVFQGEHDSGVSSLNLPIGTNNTPDAVRQIVEPPPPFGEPASSLMAKERFYNKADMIITIAANGAITVTSGVINNRGITVPQEQWDVMTNATNGFLVMGSFNNARENRTVKSLDIKVDKLRVWSSKATNILKPTWTQGDVTIIYVEDQRAVGAGTTPGVRMVNGAQLPSKGLTVATRSPMYVKGHYNNQDGSTNQTGAFNTSTGTNTVYTRPAALIGDAITVLSEAWNDANANFGLGGRRASATTVNAAFLAGIVQTTNNSYSGGVENFPRFLEDWGGGVTFTYNGSMVVMYPSQIATGPWRGTSEVGIYVPPTRGWAFDTNFRTPEKLPPGTPCVRVLLRSVWAMVQPNSTNVVVQ